MPTSSLPNIDTIPQDFRPDRMEVMNAAGENAPIKLANGVTFECFVGNHNHAKNLSSGLVRFEPGAHLAYHTHPFAESITVLSGKLTLNVAGRRYALGPLDNITIPPFAPHSAELSEQAEPVLAHASLNAHQVTRDLVEPIPVTQEMPDDCEGFLQPEYVVRHSSATRYEAGPGTKFIDFFNSRLIPGLQMSGGYGLFYKGGRLPAHIHDFDESITIIRGTATCNVEGRLYSMADNATALQPRGRVHYFINEYDAPMAMLWVYAGSRPDRIEVDESLTMPGADPWKEASTSLTAS